MQRACALVVLLVAAGVSALPSSFMETRSRVAQPCYPPPCPGYLYGAAVPVAASASVGGVGGMVARAADGSSVGVGVSAGGPQVVLQNNAVDIETDGGFVISLPSPPPPSPDLPEYIESRGAGSSMNKLILRQRQKIKLLDRKISVKKQALLEHNQWLEQAKRAIERVKRQIHETRESRTAIKTALDNLKSQKHSELVATTRRKLAKELSETRAKLDVLTEQHSRVHLAGEAIQRKRQRMSKQILNTGKQLKWHHKQLKAKIQQFEDQENTLAQIGTTPRSVTKIDELQQDEEDSRMGEI